MILKGMFYDEKKGVLFDIGGGENVFGTPANDTHV